MSMDYEVTKFDVTLGGKVVGEVEKSKYSDYWIAFMKVADGTEYPQHFASIGKSPDEAMRNIVPEARERITHMLRDLERIENAITVPTLAELTNI